MSEKPPALTENGKEKKSEGRLSCRARSKANGPSLINNGKKENVISNAIDTSNLEE